MCVGGEYYFLMLSFLPSLLQFTMFAAVGHKFRAALFEEYLQSYLSEKGSSTVVVLTVDGAITDFRGIL